MAGTGISWISAICGVFSSAFALVASLPASAQQQTAVPAIEKGKWIGANEPFEIELAGEAAQRVAVLIDTLDVTALFDRPATHTIRYRGDGPPFPPGAHVITIYGVDDSGSWRQLEQFPIGVLSRRGFQRVAVVPTADFTGKGQPSESHSPDANAPPRDGFKDATTQLALRAELVRPAFTVRAEGQVAGVTYQNEALRFGSEGEDAPKVDLSGYRIDLERNATQLSIGHIGYGAFRHLVNGLQSRGVLLTLGRGRNATLQLAALSGSSIVGWSNPLGLENGDHRVWGASFGAELIPRTPGLLRFESALFEGSLQPFTGFNQGAVVFSEKSKGGALRILTAEPTGRWRFDGGYSTSEFEQAFDEEVEGGLAVTPIATKRSDAWYADVSLGLLQPTQIGAHSTSLTLNLRHEEIDPLYRSVGAPVQADLLTDGAGLQFAFGPAIGVIAHVRARDNLADLDSVLTSLSRRWSMNLSLPVGALVANGGTAPRWAPVLSLQADQMHQYGDGVPVGGGFTIENVPDQVSWNAMLSAEWQLGAWRVGGRVGGNQQDNRQAGLENADFETSNYVVLLGWLPTPKISLGAELGIDTTDNIRDGTSANTVRWLGNLSWVLWKEVALVAAVTNSRAWDDLDTREQTNVDGFVELSTGFKLPSVTASGGRGRLFVRWTDQRARMRDDNFGLRDDRDSSTLLSGITLSVF